MQRYLLRLSRSVLEQAVAATLLATRNTLPSVSWGLLLLDVCLSPNPKKQPEEDVKGDGQDPRLLEKHVQSRDKIFYALVKMSANESDVYGLLEVVGAAMDTKHALQERDWTLSLQTAWACRMFVPDEAYRSSFAALLRGMQQSHMPLTLDTTRIILQFLVDTDPIGPLTWRMLEKLSKDKVHSFVECVALSTMILESISTHVSLSNPLRLSEPLYGSERYLYVVPASNAKAQTDSLRRMYEEFHVDRPGEGGGEGEGRGEGEGEGDYESFRRDLNKAWVRTHLSQGRSELYTVLSTGLNLPLQSQSQSQSQSHCKSYAGCLLSDDHRHSDVTTDQLSLIIVHSAYLLSSSGRHDRAFALLHAWALRVCRNT
jgi:hypothetical protein